MLEYILIGLLFIACIIIWRLWSIYSTCINTIEDYGVIVEDNQKVHQKMYEDYTAILEKMKEMDHIHAYEFNDELGVFFKYIKETLLQLEQYYNEE